MIERCGDRQRKFDGLHKWPFWPFVESLPIMLQVFLLLLACRLCRYMCTINAPVALLLITLTIVGVLFYLAIVVASASSDACPFQTPALAALRDAWKGTGNVWKRIWLKIITPASHFKQALSPTRRASNRRARRRNSFPSPTPLGNIYVQPPGPWSTQVDIRVLQTMHTNDARCVSWILWNITDPEAVEAAIRLAGTIRWFENGVDVKPPYELIVSAFHECFDSTGKVHPGSRDMAYYSIYGLSCGSASMRRVNPRMFHPNSPDQPSGTRAPALTPTSRISSKSATARTKTFSSLICIASARRLLQPTYNGLRTQCYTFRGRRGARPTPLSPLVNSGWKRIGVPSL